jgi:hypothetical protein
MAACESEVSGDGLMCSFMFSTFHHFYVKVTVFFMTVSRVVGEA